MTKKSKALKEELLRNGKKRILKHCKIKGAVE